jgi:hypothetical protein
MRVQRLGAKAEGAAPVEGSAVCELVFIGERAVPGRRS